MYYWTFFWCLFQACNIHRPFSVSLRPSLSSFHIVCSLPLRTFSLGGIMNFVTMEITLKWNIKDIISMIFYASLVCSWNEMNFVHRSLIFTLPISCTCDKNFSESRNAARVCYMKSVYIIVLTKNSISSSIRIQISLGVVTNSHLFSLSIFDCSMLDKIRSPKGAGTQNFKLAWSCARYCKKTTFLLRLKWAFMT